MLIRLILTACIAALASGAAQALSEDSGRRDGSNNNSVWMDLGHPVKAEQRRRATRVDVERLKKLQVRPAVKCARVEYIHQCLSSQNMTLVRARCRAGSTEASCCKAIRDYVTSHICGPIWDRLKKAGRPYYPGIFVCKCIETEGAGRIRPGPHRPGAS